MTLLRTVTTLVAIICITILLLFALAHNIDGTALAAGCAVIAGLGGVTLPAGIKKLIIKPPK